MRVYLKISRYNKMVDVVRVETRTDSGIGSIAIGSGVNAKSISKMVRDLNCTLINADRLRDVVKGYYGKGCPEEGEEIEISSSGVIGSPTFHVRGTTTQASASSRHDSFDAALQVAGSQEVFIEWREEFRDQCCCVDLDWHGTKSPYDATSFRQFVTSLVPAPAFAWVTRSNGLRLVYTGSHADLRAAVAAVRAADRFSEGLTGVELKTQTRGPGDATVWRNVEDFDLSCIWPRAASSDDAVDDEAWAEWLRGHGLSFGRFSHDHCLISPQHTSNSPAPVEVRPSGVMCHSCGGRTGRGWLSASYLLRGESTFSQLSPLSNIVSNISHYEHAKYIIEEYVPKVIQSDIQMLYYRALLYSWHGVDDNRIESAFRDRQMLRFNGYWGTTTGERRDSAKCRVAVSNLPACRDTQGEVIAEKVEIFMDSVDLESFGYPAIRPVFGHRIGTYHPDVEVEQRVPRIVVPNTTVRHKPVYVNSSRRMPRDEAWGVMKSVYPGIDYELVEMLIYCRGLVERGCSSLHPKFLFDGVSGSGKTSHPHIAAAICGDRCTDVIAVNDDERLGQKIHEAMRVGSFATIDEVVKSAKKARVDTRTFLTFILNLSPESSVHALYIGQIRFGWLPILCLTDTEYPEDVLADEQLGRRLIYRHLGTERLNWELSTRRAGLTHWADPRSAGGEVQLACDSILSHVIDTYFNASPPDIIDVASQKGFRFLNADGHAERRKLLLRDLFLAWQRYKTPDAYQGDEQGWKTFAANEDGDLARLWSRVHDEGNPTSWARMNERSWSQATGHPYPLRGKVEPFRRGNANVVRIRFEEQVDGEWRALTTEAPIQATH